MSPYAGKQPTMSSAAQARLRLALLKETRGDSSKQKDTLVQTILDAFHNPEQWPLSDGERCDFLRGLYRSARTIRETEQAEQQIKAP